MPLPCVKVLSQLQCFATTQSKPPSRMESTFHAYVDIQSITVNVKGNSILGWTFIYWVYLSKNHFKCTRCPAHSTLKLHWHMQYMHPKDQLSCRSDACGLWWSQLDSIKLRQLIYCVHERYSTCIINAFDCPTGSGPRRNLHILHIYMYQRHRSHVHCTIENVNSMHPPCILTRI
jgi:hypothetical protein